MENVEQIVQNFDSIRAEVDRLSGGKATLVLASKTVSADVLRALSEARPGVIYGENRVQELLSKYFVSEKVTWQFIGRLQTNKVKYIADKVDLIQSVDSLKLAEEIEKRSAAINKVMDVLIEVNVGGEESKGGVSPEALYSLAERIRAMKHLRLKGIMSVLPNADEAVLVPLYEELTGIFNALKEKGFELEYLSAGMSGDYYIALCHGANMVRIGSAVFGARNYAK